MPALAYLVEKAHGSLSNAQPLLEKHLHDRATPSNKGGPSNTLDAIYMGSFIALAVILVLMCLMANKCCRGKKE
ncbi:hypothetical protein ACHAPO_008277 [Fusarium lateritium]